VMQLEAEREELKAKACAESEAFAQQKKEEIASLQSQFHRVSQEICAAALEGQESLKLEAELLRAEVVQLKAEQDQHQNEKKEVQVELLIAKEKMQHLLARASIRVIFDSVKVE